MKKFLKDLFTRVLALGITFILIYLLWELMAYVFLGIPLSVLIRAIFAR